MQVVRKDKEMYRYRRKLVVIVMLLAMLATSVMPSRPAMAQCVSVCDAPQTAIESAFKTGNLQILGTIFGILGTLYNFISGAFTTITQQGYSAVSSAVVGSNMINTKMQEMTANFGAQTAMYVPQVVATADAQARATLAAQSNACAVTRYEQAMERLGRRDQLSGAESFIESNMCKGVNADCLGPKRKKERYDDLCKLGLISNTAYGDLTANCTPPPDPSYADRYKNLAIFLNSMQMVLASPCILADGYPSFAGTAACTGGTAAAAQYNADPAQSQLAWVAAFKFCEGLDTSGSTPAAGTGRAINPSDVDSIIGSGDADVLRAGAKKDCLKALFDRTACPAGVNAQAVGIAESCHDDQVAVCHALRAVPNAGGTNVYEGQYPVNSDTDGGMGFATDPALQNCDQNGLSILKIKEIKSHPCSDQTYMQGQANRLHDQQKLDDFANTTCAQLDADFAKLLAHEEEAITAAMQAAGQNRMNGTGTAGTTAPSSR